MHAGRCAVRSQHTWQGIAPRPDNETVMILLEIFLTVCLFVLQDNVNSLLPVFEEFLKNAPQEASYDSVRQSVIILMGSLAKHLDKSDPKVKPIVAKLITALSTPSQQV